MEDCMTDEFKQEIEVLLNKYSMENKSDTPDYILAQYLTDCLKAFERATYDREKWHGRIQE